MIPPLAPSDRHILLADPDPESRTVARQLQREGYTIDVVSTLEEALTTIEEYPSDLVLTDLFVTHPLPRLDAVRWFRRRCQPTPVGILTAWPFAPEEATREGFAFLLPKPIDMHMLRARITTVLHPPLTPEQAQQARLIQRYVQAIKTADWEVMRTICTPDVGYYPLTGSPFTLAREIIGIEAMLTHAQQVRRRVPNLRIERAIIFAQALDVLVRYRASWQASNGERHSVGGFVICRFRGERIFQIGVTQHWQRM